VSLSTPLGLKLFGRRSADHPCSTLSAVRRMKQLGEETLLKDSTSSSPTFKFGFHIPPFTRCATPSKALPVCSDVRRGEFWSLTLHRRPLDSVAHIHLHAFQLPHSSASAKVEFRSTRRSHERLGKSFGWFVELDQVRLTPHPPSCLVSTSKRGRRLTDTSLCTLHSLQVIDILEAGKKVTVKSCAV
jgi:hypothetical protein